MAKNSVRYRANMEVDIVDLVQLIIEVGGHRISLVEIEELACLEAAHGRKITRQDVINCIKPSRFDPHAGMHQTAEELRVRSLAIA
jgi:hypothetical protein